MDGATSRRYQRVLLRCVIRSNNEGSVLCAHLSHRYISGIFYSLYVRFAGNVRLVSSSGRHHDGR